VWTCFIALNMGNPEDNLSAGALVPESWGGLPSTGLGFGKSHTPPHPRPLSSEEGNVGPWVTPVWFLEAPGDAVFFDGRMVHWGSGRHDAGRAHPCNQPRFAPSLTAKGGCSRRYIAFAAITSHKADYNSTNPVTIPSWATNAPQPDSAPAPDAVPQACGVCQRSQALVPCVVCGVTPLCRHHAAQECPRCQGKDPSCARSAREMDSPRCVM